MLFKVLFVFAALLLPQVVAAQTFVPDDRYNGYPKSLVNMVVTPLVLTTCVAQEYYEPLDLHLVQYETRVQVARVRVQEFDECTWMLTRNSWRWVLRPAGTKVAVDGQGRDLFDFGSPTGNKCANPRPFSAIIRPLDTVIATEVAPPPVYEPLIKLDIVKAVESIKIDPPCDEEEVVVAAAPVVEKKRSWGRRILVGGILLVAGKLIHSKITTSTPSDLNKQVESPGGRPGGG